MLNSLLNLFLELHSTGTYKYYCAVDMHNFNAERDQKHVVNLVDPDPAVHGLDLQK